ncbi:DUF2855 family protein [Actinoplanes sp. KI2]|uniref:DUF2855 family protein n=1 Tax=Actinoplanes sp. KI2 TaxID=2983315 RepID=UPI0021D5A197|nr:DUF2855 family protein [Actinoplanes sp. KI2]MCU7726055.1 DUF2855 family protein [Actinoplanes sp. KI2]
MTSSSWTFAVSRDNLEKSILSDGDTPSPGSGEVVLRVDRVGLTANNVTYAVLGSSMRYWDFFPPAARGLGPEWGLPPLWGFADVVASRVPGVLEGRRFYGFLPPASDLIVRADRIDETGFHDASPHRADLPSPYNSYRLTTGDPAYRHDQEDLMILLRPLFFTSFMLADYLVDNAFFGASTLVVSSASSKTAYGAALSLRGSGPRLIGLTSPGNVAFTRSLGCYDEVLPYGADLGDPGPTAYLDLSGTPATRAELRAKLGSSLVRDVAVGLTNQVPDIDAADELFFAPVQMGKRRRDWGRDELDRRFAEAWHRFTGAVGGWLSTEVGHGPDGLRSAWSDVLAGRVRPNVGRIVQL